MASSDGLLGQGVWQAVGAVDDVVSLGRGQARRVAWSADGQTLAVASPLGITLYDARSFEPVRQRESSLQAWPGLYPGQAGQAASGYQHDTHRCTPRDKHGDLGPLSAPHVTSRDGRAVALASGETVEVWQVGPDSPKPTLRMTLAVSEVTCLALSDDGGLLAVARGSWIDLWQLRPREYLGALPMATQPVTHMAFAPERPCLAVVARGLALIWKISGDSVTRLAQHAPTAQRVAVTRDGMYVAALGEGTLNVWRVADGKLHLTADDGDLESVALAFEASGEILAASTRDGVRLWSVRERKAVRLLPTGSGIRSLAFTPDGQRLTVVGQDAIRRWSHHGEMLPDTGRSRLDRAADVSISQDGETVAIRTGQQLRVYRLDGTAPTWETSAVETMRSLTLSPDGCALAAVSDTGVWWWRCGQVAPRRLALRVDYARFAPDGSVLAVVRGDTVSLWRADRLSPTPAVRIGDSQINDIGLMPGTPRLVVAASDDGVVRLQGVPG